MEKRKTWWLLLSVAIVNAVSGIVVQALVWIGPVFRSQSSAVGQWLLLWNLVQGLLVVVSGYLGVSAYLKKQRKAIRATSVALFDHIIDAIGYFNDDVVPEMEHAIETYTELLTQLHLGSRPTKTQRYALDNVIKALHFEKVFQRLNIFAGFARIPNTALKTDLLRQSPDDLIARNRAEMAENARHLSLGRMRFRFR